MDNATALQPTKRTNFLNTKTGELEIKYRPGSPRIYRFDASRGTVDLMGHTTLTRKGEPFAFIPVAYRLFQDDILGYGPKRWIEFFFLNEAGHLCTILFHGYSVSNLLSKTDDLFYDGVNLTQVQLTAKPVERTKVLPGGSTKYFIAEFEYIVLGSKGKEDIQLIHQSLNIWRQGTLTGDAKVESSIGFRSPFSEIEEIARKKNAA